MSDEIQECLWRRRTDPNFYKKREMIQHDFVQTVYGEPFFISALDLYKELEGHHGCVNSLCWSTKGDKLLSGSDDQTIRIWHPFENYSSDNHVIQTGHRGNIFSAKFMPHTSDSIIVTAAADSEIRIFDLNASSHLSHVYTCHSDSVKRIGINNTSPYEFLTCSEDGTVRHFDTRFPHICTPHIVQTFITSTQQWSRQYTNQHRNIAPRPLQYKCSKPLLDYSQYGLDINSMTVNKLRPQYFALAGMDDYMYLHDMRMISQSFADDQASRNFSLSSTGRSRCVKRFRPTRPENHKVKQSNKYVTACKFSDTNGDELLGNWAGEGVYLFNIHDSPSEPRYIESTFREPSSSKSHMQYFESLQKPLIDLHANTIEDNSLTSVVASRLLQLSTLSLIPSSSSTKTTTKTKSTKKSFYKLADKYRDAIIDKVEYGIYPLALQYINDYYIELKYHCQLDLLSRHIHHKKETIQLNHAWLHCMRAIIFAKQAIENITTTEKLIEQEDEKNFVPYLDRIFLLKNTSEFSTVKTQMVKAEKFASNNWRGLWCIAVAYWLICSDYENVIPTTTTTTSQYDTIMNDTINDNVNNILATSSQNHHHHIHQLNNNHQPHRKRKGMNLKGNIITEYLHKVYKFSEQAISLLDNEIKKLKNDDKTLKRLMLYLQTIMEYQEALKELSNNSKKALQDMMNLGDDDAKTILEKINSDHDNIKGKTDDDDDSMYEADSDSLSSESSDEDTTDWFKSLYPPSATWLPTYIINNDKNKQHNGGDNMNEDDGNSSTSSSDSHIRCLVNVQEVDLGDDDDESNNNSHNSDDDNDILRSLAHHHINYFSNIAGDDDDDDGDDDDDDEPSQHVGIGRRVNYYSNEALEDDDNSFFRSEEDEHSYRFDELNGLNDLERQQDVLRKDLEFEADVVGHRKKYTGHSNLKTIKDVNFYGCKDEYIVSGSDDGCCFIWDKNTAKIVQVLEADSDTVNIIQGHPNLPILAVSGIDDTIKIFQPTANDIHVPSKSSKMDHLDQIILNNHRTHVRRRNDAFLTRSLLESIPLVRRSFLIDLDDDDDDEDDDDDDDVDDEDISDMDEHEEEDDDHYDDDEEDNITFSSNHDSSNGNSDSNNANINEGVFLLMIMN